MLFEEIEKTLLEALADADNFDERMEAVRLAQAQLKIKSENRWVQKFSPIFPAVASLLGILTIVAYEERHIIASRALGFVQRV